jgi:hypothetical protein
MPQAHYNNGASTLVPHAAGQCGNPDLPDGGGSCVLGPVRSASAPVWVRCVTHDLTTLDSFGDAQAGYRRFRCDFGAGQRFLVQDLERSAPPWMLDLTGLHSLVTAYAEAAEREGGAPEEPVRLWRWATAGVLEELSVRRGKRSDFDEHDYAATEWRVLGSDDTVHATVTVYVDGRA